jgi:hypothetical protein
MVLGSRKSRGLTVARWPEGRTSLNSWPLARIFLPKPPLYKASIAWGCGDNFCNIFTVVQCQWKMRRLDKRIWLCPVGFCIVFVGKMLPKFSIEEATLEYLLAISLCGCHRAEWSTQDPVPAFSWLTVAGWSPGAWERTWPFLLQVSPSLSTLSNWELNRLNKNIATKWGTEWKSGNTDLPLKYCNSFILIWGFYFSHESDYGISWHFLLVSNWLLWQSILNWYWIIYYYSAW